MYIYIYISWFAFECLTGIHLQKAHGYSHNVQQEMRKTDAENESMKWNIYVESPRAKSKATEKWAMNKEMEYQQQQQQEKTHAQM